MSKFELLPFQKEIVEKAWTTLLRCRMLYYAIECRVGKTIIALATIRRLIDTKKQEDFHVLFLTKKKAISSIEDDYVLTGYQFKLTVTNYEALHKLDFDTLDFVVCDESHCLGTPGKPSKKTKQLKLILKKFNYASVIYLTGTPSPETYSQLFHQFWISSHSPWNKYVNFYKWARSGYVNITQNNFGGGMVNNYDDADYNKIMDDIGHLIFTYTQEKAGIQQQINEHFLEVKMSDVTRKRIEILKRDKVLEGKTEVILADTAVKEMTKVHQLASGTIKFESGKRMILDRTKAEFVKRTFKGEKIAIMYLYIAEGELLRETFPNHTGDPKEFNESDDKVFIGQIKSSREGVNLSSADALVMYNLEFSALSYLQGKERMTNKDRTKDNNVYWVFSDCGIEKRVYKAVSKKIDFTSRIYRGEAQSQLNF